MKNNIVVYRIYLIGFLAILCLPLLIFPPWFTPIGWGKTIIFRIIASFLLVIFSGQLLYGRISREEIKEKIKSVFWPFWLLIALFSIFILATLFSVDRGFSLWGSPYRSGGFINFAFYIVVAILSFLVIKKSDWKKLIDFSILIGLIVSIIAVFQQFGVFSNLLISFNARPVSTVGNPIVLAIYLLLLSFPCLSLLIAEKSKGKKIFYIISLSLFLIVSIVLTQTRAAFLGLLFGLIWFLLAYPKKKVKTIGISALLGIIILMFGAKIYLDNHLEVYQKLPLIISDPIDRILSVFEGAKAGESRLSTWKVAIEGIKEKPILGYGPENFMIAFDKNYDPTLPIIGATSTHEMSEWWDRPHNILLEVAISSGIFGALIYISLFGAIIWFLQKSKKSNPETALMAHGLISAFIAYFIANLTSFDCFETYLTFFLLFGFSMSIISGKEGVEFKEFKPIKYRTIAFPIVIILWLIFVWSYNIVPMEENKRVNDALAYAKNNCQKALSIEEKYGTNDSIIYGYLADQWIDIIKACANSQIKPITEFIADANKILEKNAQINPNFSKNWLALGEYQNALLEEKIKASNDTYSSDMAGIKQKADMYFQKALLLAPKKQEFLKEWANTAILSEDFKTAESRLSQCINLNQNYSDCYFSMALTQGYLKNINEFTKYYNLAKDKKYAVDNSDSLYQLATMYLKIGDFKNTETTYQKLINMVKTNREKAQLCASLAFIYRGEKDYKNAKYYALKVVEFEPSSELMVNEFLKTLK